MKKRGRKTVKKTVAKAIFLKRKGQEYLICLEKRRHDETNYAGVWGLPQGHKKKSENIIKTLKREMLEELAVRVISYKKLGVFRDTDFTSKHHYTHHVFVCFEWAGLIAHTFEQELIAWVPLKEAFNFNLPEVDKKILHKLVKME
ncbi:MAG: NUDIX domain-containing protein [archaeon]|nr:MAG: NUDIX domain-containing protein [archaeon]